MPKPGECSAAALWGRFGIKNHQTRPPRCHSASGFLLDSQDGGRSCWHLSLTPLSRSGPSGTRRSILLIAAALREPYGRL